MPNAHYRPRFQAALATAHLLFISAIAHAQATYTATRVGELQLSDRGSFGSSNYDSPTIGGTGEPLRGSTCTAPSTFANTPAASAPAWDTASPAPRIYASTSSPALVRLPRSQLQPNIVTFGVAYHFGPEHR